MQSDGKFLAQATYDFDHEAPVGLCSGVSLPLGVSLVDVEKGKCVFGRFLSSCRFLSNYHICSGDVHRSRASEESV